MDIKQKTIIFFLLFSSILATRCDREEKLHFERISLIGFSWRAEDTIPVLRIGRYFELNSENENYHYTNYANNSEHFYKAHVSQQLIELVNANFTNITFDSIMPPNLHDNEIIYDGWSYCFGIKPQGEMEKFYYFNTLSINRVPYKTVYNYINSIMSMDTIENIKEPPQFEIRKKFINDRFEWHKKKMPKLRSNIKFTPPVIKPYNE